MLALLRAIHPFSPILLFTILKHSYIATIICPSLFSVSFRFSQLPWGLREGWRLKYFSILNHSKGTQIVFMSEWGSFLISLKNIFDQDVGFILGCHLLLTLHLLLLLNKYNIYWFTNCPLTPAPDYFCCSHRSIFLQFLSIVGHGLVYRVK